MRVTSADKKLGEKIRELRLMRGLTQSNVAEVLGITFQQLQKYEQGKNRIAATKLIELARLLNTDPNQLLEIRIPANSNTPKKPGFASNNEIAQLCKAFSEIRDSNKRRQILQLIKVLNQ